MMSDETLQNATADVKPNEQLPTEELSDVSGGTKVVDKSSAKLHTACATGDHGTT
jgi:hypothetical protein